MSAQSETNQTIDVSSAEPEVTLESTFEEFRTDLQGLVASSRDLNARFKKLVKQCNRELKAKRPKKARDSTKPKTPSGFNKPHPVPEQLVSLLGLDDGAELPRTQVTKRLYQYFEDHDLYAEKDDGSKDKRRIIPNREVRKVFSMKKGEEITFYTIQSHIKKLYPTATTETA